MSEIIKRALAKQRLADPQGLTLMELLDKLYDVLDNAYINPNAKVTFHNSMYADFMCSKCGIHNGREYNETILDWEVDVNNSSYNDLHIFIKQRR